MGVLVGYSGLVSYGCFSELWVGMGIGMGIGI